jgi:hypothetical protein
MNLRCEARSLSALAILQQARFSARWFAQGRLNEAAGAAAAAFVAGIEMSG